MGCNFFYKLIKCKERFPLLDALQASDARRQARLQFFVPLAFPASICQGDYEVFKSQGRLLFPSAMSPGEPATICRNSHLFKQSWSIPFVLAARTNQFSRVQHFSNVMRCCPEQNSILVKRETWPLSLQ